MTQHSLEGQKSKGACLRRGVIVATLLLSIGTYSPGEVLTEHYLKGAFLYNFVRLTEWPDSIAQNETFDICMIGRSDIVDDVKAALAGKSLNARRVVVRKIRDVRSSSNCQVVFLGGEGQETAAQDLKLLPRGVMTVGETDDFLKKGGMIRFVNTHGRLTFEVSVSVAQQQGVKLSSRLLSVAHRVE